MRKIAKESIFQLLPRNARFYLTVNLNSLSFPTTLWLYYKKLFPFDPFLLQEQ